MNNPFGIQWLDSSYQQTCLPDTPWQKILDQLEPVLASRIRQQFHHAQRRQILLELVGQQFQSTYFLDEYDQSYLLKPPFMSDDERRKLENEAKSWLQIQTQKSAIDIHAAVNIDENENYLSNSMKLFLEYAYEITSKSLERYLYKLEEKQALIEEREKLEEIRKKKHLLELTGRAKLRSILHQSKFNSTKLPIINESIIKPNEMTSKYSDVISHSILAVLKCDLRRIVFIRERLFGQQLPNKLRQFIWTECLIRFERKTSDYNLGTVELEIRRNFVAEITKGKQQFKLNNPSHSPLANLIENAVIEAYSQIHVLYPYLDEYHLRKTIQILNILYTCKKIYEPYFIYWLLPFQLTYNDEINKDEEIYVITMHLYLFIDQYFPCWSNVFTIANRIMHELSKTDADLYNHLTRIANIRTKIRQKDFIREIITLDSQLTQFSHDLLSDPILFIRKWISQMFIGILNSNAILYIWDQFFLHQWDINILEIATKIIFFLLRSHFLRANDYEQMRHVFLNEPSRLYTSDIQKAFIHVGFNRHKYIQSIPNINRRDSMMKSNDNQRIGFRNFSLNLLVPVKKNPQNELKYHTIVIEIQIFNGQNRLDSMVTKTVPIIRNQEQTVNDWQKVSLDIPNEELIFSIKKTSLTNHIQALVIIHQRPNVSTLKTLAYCRISREMVHSYGPIRRALHPGIPPILLEQIADQPRVYLADKIGPNSAISLLIFNSN